MKIIDQINHMKVIKIIKDFFILSVTILILDKIYLGSVLSDPFMKMIEKIQKKEGNVNYTYAIVVYLLMVVGIHTFIINDKRSAMSAFLLGTIIYGVFDFTNLAIFSDYSLELAIHDTIWGGTLFYITTKIYELINRSYKK